MSPAGEGQGAEQEPRNRGRHKRLPGDSHATQPEAGPHLTPLGEAQLSVPVSVSLSDWERCRETVCPGPPWVIHSSTLHFSL